VLDLHPLVPVDPLAQLIEESSKQNRPNVARLATIVIDPGHGGEDPGALGRHGSREKDVTLSIARRLKTLVDAEPNMRALLTAMGDYFCNDARVEARKVKTDLFVSIHADVRPARCARLLQLALPDRRATSSLRAARKSAERVDLIGGANAGEGHCVGRSSTSGDRDHRPQPAPGRLGAEAPGPVNFCTNRTWNRRAARADGPTSRRSW
jgi:N-acetylmuramoyl-L-alanine amidase